MRSNSRRDVRRGALRSLVVTFVVLLLTGCSALRHPVPLEAQNDPSIPGFTNIRFFPLTDVEPMRQSIRQAFLTETPDNYDQLADGWRRYNYLAISGGGRSRNFDFLNFAKKLGAKGILEKPFRREGLLDAVNKALSAEG